MDFDEVQKWVTMVGAVGAFAYQMYQWWVPTDQREAIKTDLEILKLLDPESDEYQEVDHRVKRQIRDEYSGTADIRRRTFRSLVVRSCIGWFVLVPYGAYAIYSGNLFWGVSGIIVGVLLWAGAQLNYLLRPT